jgi:hypothetical protein
MRDDSLNDLRTIWQNQPAEPSVMTSERIRQKTHELNTKTGQALFGRIATALLMIGIAGYGIATSDIPVLRAVFACAIAWSMAGQYFVNRSMRLPTTPGEAGLRPSLESYRQEVERRRNLSSRFLLWSLGPIMLTIAAFIALILSFGIRNPAMVPTGALFKMIPFLTTVAIWVVSVFVIRMRDRRELQREIDELDKTERDAGNLSL